MRKWASVLHISCYVHSWFPDHPVAVCRIQLLASTDARLGSFKHTLRTGVQICLLQEVCIWVVLVLDLKWENEVLTCFLGSPCNVEDWQLTLTTVTSQIMLMYMELEPMALASVARAAVLNGLDVNMLCLFQSFFWKTGHHRWLELEDSPMGSRKPPLLFSILSLGKLFPPSQWVRVPSGSHRLQGMWSIACVTTLELKRYF